MASPPTSKGLHRRDLLRAFGASGVLLGGGSLLAACGGDETTTTADTSTPSATGTPAATATEAASEPATIQFSSYSLNEEVPAEVIQSFIDDWADKTNNEVKAQALPYNEYLDQLLLQVRGGNVTGAAQLDINRLSTLAATGSLVDLGAAAADQGYTETALLTGQVDGVQYGLPWTTGSIGMLGNAELLEQAGISEPPRTIAEFETTLEALAGLGGGVVPYAGMTDIAQMKDILMWMWTFGSDVLVDGELLVSGPEAVQAVEWYASLLNDGYISSGVDRFDARALFAQGNAAMYDDAIIGRGAVVGESPDPDFADKVIPVPRPLSDAVDEPQAMLWGHVVVVLEGGDTDAAIDFVTYLTATPEVALTYFEQTGLPPTTEEALNADVVQEDTYTSEWTDKITATARPNPFWPYPESARMESILGEQVQAAMVGQATAQEAMDRASEEISELL